MPAARYHPTAQGTDPRLHPLCLYSVIQVGAAAKLILKDLQGLVVIDEFQRQPELLELFRALADCRPLPARFLVLGSAAPLLVKGVSESLAGRVGDVQMSGFSLEEASADQMDALWGCGIHPGERAYPLSEDVEALPLSGVGEVLRAHQLG